MNEIDTILDALSRLGAIGYDDERVRLAAALLAKAYDKLAAEQVDLDPESERVLRDNLWTLYG